MFCVLQGSAKVKLSAVFSDNMVLQQQTDAAIWGKASGRKVTVITSWNKKSYVVKTDRNGNFKLKVQTPKAGGPYEITFFDGEKLTINEVLIGEVWFCSGQSNMEMPVKGFFNQPVLHSNEAIACSTNTYIRLFFVNRNTTLSPLDNFLGGEKWKKCIPGNVANFSAAAYFFGMTLQKALGIPVGLIDASHGDSRIEPWMSKSALQYFDFVNLPDEKMKENISYQTPTVLYNAMVHPFIGYAIKGVIWYQGESNQREPEHYEKLLPGLIKDWRENWNIGNFSFYYAQIAPCKTGIEHDNFKIFPSYYYPHITPRSSVDVNSAFLREVQLKASTVLPNTGMACMMDIGEAHCVHPKHKKITGERFALLALSKTYGMKGIVCEGPTLKEMTINGNIVKLTFNNASNGLTSYGKKLKHFKVAGEDKRFYPAAALITLTGITLSSSCVDKVVAVRYAFDDFVAGDLFNTYGLPASCFRTDDWE